MAGIYLTQKDREEFINIFDDYFQQLHRCSRKFFNRLNNLNWKTQYQPYIEFVKTSADAYNAAIKQIDKKLYAVDIKAALQSLQAGDDFEREFVAAFSRVCACSEYLRNIDINVVPSGEPEMGKEEFEEAKSDSREYSATVKKINEHTKKKIGNIGTDNTLSQVFGLVLAATVTECEQFIASFEQTLQRFEDAYSQIRRSGNGNPNPPPLPEGGMREGSNLNRNNGFNRRNNSNSNNGGGNGGGNADNQQQNIPPEKVKFTIAEFGPAIAMVKLGDVDDRFEAFCDLTRAISNKVKPNIPLDDSSKEDAKKMAAAYEYALKNIGPFIVLRSSANNRKSEWDYNENLIHSVKNKVMSILPGQESSKLDIASETVGQLNSDKAYIKGFLDNKITTQEIVEQAMDETKPKFRKWSSYDAYTKITQKVIVDPDKMGWAFLALSRNLTQNTRLSTSTVRFNNRGFLGIHGIYQTGEDTAKNAPARLEYHMNAFADMLLGTQENTYWKNGYSRLKYEKEDISLLSEEDAAVNTRMLLERYRMEQVRADRYFQDMWEDFNSAKETGGKAVGDTLKLMSTAVSIACPQATVVAAVIEEIGKGVSAMEFASSLDIKEYLKKILVKANPQIDIDSPVLEEKVSRLERMIATLANVKEDPNSAKFKEECKEGGLNILSAIYGMIGFAVDDNDALKTKAVLSTLYDAKEKCDQVMDFMGDMLPNVLQSVSKELTENMKKYQKYNGAWDAVREYFDWRGERYPVLSASVAKCPRELRVDLEAAYLSSLIKLRNSLGAEPNQQQIAAACKSVMKDSMHYDIESEPFKSALACLG